MSSVYVVRKSCGCIIAAFTQNLKSDAKAEIVKQLIKSGYDVDLATESEVRARFDLNCSCGNPPLLNLMDRAHFDQVSIGNSDNDGGVDTEDVNAGGVDDLTPGGDADELIDQEISGEEDKIKSDSEQDSEQEPESESETESEVFQPALDEAVEVPA
jgi:hypothetical protein